ncbi:MAG: Adenylate/guanylate cyclase, partial [Verrucomicrobiales bacterium]|nr:Adenylate/guanylate cyclase [Verrucomicrobiales bacterium]
MKFRQVKWVPILIAFVVTGIVCLLEILPHFYPKIDFAQRVEWITYDRRMRSAATHSSHASTNLAFVYISDDSITAVSDGSIGYKYGLYWPRHIYGRALKELAAEDCKAVAFDVLFGELRPDHAPVAMPDNSLLESDEYFARELKNSRTLLATTPSLIPPELFQTNCFSLADISADKDSDGVLRRAKAFRDIRFWHPLLNQIAREAGFDLNKTDFEQHTLTFHLPGDRQIQLNLDETARLDLSEFVFKITGEKPPEPLPKVFPFEMRRIWQMG